MHITVIDGMQLIDYLPIGKTMFDFYIPNTSKCNGLVDEHVKWKEYLICNGIESFLESKKSVDVMIQEENEEGVFVDAFSKPSLCEIKSYGLITKNREKMWFEETFIYSYVRYVSRRKPTDNPLNLSKKDVIYTVLNKKSGYTYAPKAFSTIKTPMEIVELLWDEKRNWLIIRPYIRFNADDIIEKVGKEGEKELLNYLYKNINALKYGDKADAPDSLNKRFSFLKKCSPWMNAEEYRDLGDTEKKGVPGIYTLFDKNCENNIYYTGKAIDMSTRIVAPQFKNGVCTVGHPKEDKEFRQFSEVRFDAFQFAQFIDFCNLYQQEIKDKEEHKAEDAAFTEQVLYAIEGVVNHIVRMALIKQENACSVNDQFENITKNALKEKRQSS